MSNSTKDIALPILRTTIAKQNTLELEHRKGQLQPLDSALTSLLEPHDQQQESALQFNLTEVTQTAQAILKAMDTLLVNLVDSQTPSCKTKQKNTVGNAQALAGIAEDLNQKLLANKDIINTFIPFASSVHTKTLLNNPPSTIIDALIIFTHCVRDDQASLLKKLAAQQNDQVKGFLEQVQAFDLKFIKPMKHHSKTAEHIGYYNNSEAKRKEIALITARRLIPLVARVLEDYAVALPESTELPPTANSAKVQISLINQQVLQADAYYSLELATLLQVGKGKGNELNQWLKDLYHLAQIRQFLEPLDHLAQAYPVLLVKTPVLEFIRTCLSKIKDKVDELITHMGPLDTFLNQIKRLNLATTTLVQPLSTSLEQHLATLSLKETQVQQVHQLVCLSQDQKTALDTLVSSINARFFILFNQDSGLSSLVDNAIEVVQEATDVVDNPVRDSSALESSSDPLLSSELTTPLVLNLEEQSTSRKDSPFEHEVLHTVTSEVNRPRSVNDVAADELEQHFYGFDQDLLFEQKETQPLELLAEPNKAALISLIDQCYGALSLQSRCGRKGLLLTNLKDKIAEKSPLLVEDMRHAVSELAKITLSYRTTALFQARYAETRSAKAFIHALKDPKFCSLIPMSSIVFGDPIDVSKEADTHIARLLRELRVNKQWAEAAELIAPIASLS